MFVRLSRLFFFILSLVLIINCIRSALNYRSKVEKIEKEKEAVEKLGLENRKLKSELKITESDWFVESEARNKLNMCLPGEKVIIFKK